MMQSLGSFYPKCILTKSVDDPSREGKRELTFIKHLPCAMCYVYRFHSVSWLMFSESPPHDRHQ